MIIVVLLKVDLGFVLAISISMEMKKKPVVVRAQNYGHSLNFDIN